MPRSDRAAFYRRHTQTRNILVQVKGVHYSGTLLAKRHFRLTIREASRRRSIIAMLYTKLTTGDTLEYRLEPYSYRYRRLRVGIRKVFFAYKVGDVHSEKRKFPVKYQGIRMFYLLNIHAVKILQRRYRPRWRVEI